MYKSKNHSKYSLKVHLVLLSNTERKSSIKTLISFLKLRLDKLKKGLILE